MVAESEPLLFCFGFGESESDIWPKVLFVVQVSAEAFCPVIGEKMVRATGVGFANCFHPYLVVHWSSLLVAPLSWLAQ